MISWQDFLAAESEQEYFRELKAFVRRERSAGPVYPPDDLVFRAFSFAPLEETKVIVLGQDPYHGPGEADGLAFSSAPRTERGRVVRPPSLDNILRELESDCGKVFNWATAGDLSPWSAQGVLLLNRWLTVRQKSPGSHRDAGWEIFTKKAIERAVLGSRYSVHFILWGRPAFELFRKCFPYGSVEPFAPGISRLSNITFTQSPHPSPLSARTGFFGSRPFSKANEALRLRHSLLAEGPPQIDWRLP